MGADRASTGGVVDPQAKGSRSRTAPAVVKQAVDWLKNNADVLRNQRIEPLAERAREIWATLRQESNVGLDAIRLAGENTNRRVELDADVDGVKAGAFGVMSQGELHALALALFLPRATAPESPFRFVVLDDPIQAMDPAKVEGFVAVMQKIAVDRQVIVLSHDDRLPDAVRRSGVKAQIYEVTRGVGSAVTMTNSFQPSMRYLDDAFAFAKDENVPDEAKNRVIPGLCRMGLETTAHEVYSTRSYIGRPRSTHRREAMGRRLNGPAEIGVGAALRQGRPDRCVAQRWNAGDLPPSACATAACTPAPPATTRTT